MRSARMKQRSALLAVLAVLGLVPLASGVSGMVLGPAKALGGAPTTASVDSEYRFVNVFWTAAGAVLWWSIRQPEQRTRATRLVLTLAALGGIPRLLSVRDVGLPHPVFRGTIVLELIVVPLVLAWHARVIDVSSRR